MKKKKHKKSHPQSKNEVSALQIGEHALALGQYDEALKFFSSIRRDSPNYGRACKGRGAALLRLHRPNEALSFIQTAHKAFPNDADILVDGADVVRLMGGLDAAADTYREARKLGATGFQIDFGEASILQERKEWLAAIEIWEKINASFPRNPHVLHNLGRAWHELGETDMAMSLMTKSFKNGNETSTLATLALLAPHAGKCNHEDVKNFRVLLGERLKTEERNPSDNKRKIGDGEKIRIGYVSSFFHRPNWMKPVWALLNNHRREAFEVHLFADCAADEINNDGGYVSHPADKIHETGNLNNRQLAELVNDCRIDVLVDLNSYSTIRRLGLWAAKPAPVTIGWFNLYATSGLPGIEWLIGDEVVIKESEEEFYTEKILRLKQSYLTFQVGYDTPDVEFPADKPFTYGCLGSGYKITPAVRAAWIKILQKTDGTRLLVRNRVLDNQLHKRWFSDFFTQAGIDSERLILLGSAEHREFLQTYSKIDLALDTFPYNGGTTTMEALWQGVPVVCFTGNRWISRTSATLLNSGNLHEFIGANEEEYVEIAVKFSQRKMQLNALRVQMREILSSSQVCNGAELAKDFERIVCEIINRQTV